MTINSLPGPMFSASNTLADRTSMALSSYDVIATECVSALAERECDACASDRYDGRCFLRLAVVRAFFERRTHFPRHSFTSKCPSPPCAMHSTSTRAESLSPPSFIRSHVFALPPARMHDTLWPRVNASWFTLMRGANGAHIRGTNPFSISRIPRTKHSLTMNTPSDMSSPETLRAVTMMEPLWALCGRSSRLVSRVPRRSGIISGDPPPHV